MPRRLLPGVLVVLAASPLAAHVAGTPGSLTFAAQRSDGSPGSSIVLRLAFSGALSGDVVTGGLTYGMSGQANTGNGISTFSGSGTLPVTLR